MSRGNFLDTLQEGFRGSLNHRETLSPLGLPSAPLPPPRLPQLGDSYREGEVAPSHPDAFAFRPYQQMLDQGYGEQEQMRGVRQHMGSPDAENWNRSPPIQKRYVPQVPYEYEPTEQLSLSEIRRNYGPSSGPSSALDPEDMRFATEWWKGQRGQ